MNELEFPIHKLARTSFIILSVLLCFLCLTIPVAIFILFRLSSMRVKVTDRGLEARAIVTDTVDFSEVDRFGILTVPVVARGLGAIVARMRLNNLDVGLNMVFLLKNGKTVKFITNQYERHDELIQAVAARVKVPQEAMQMGLFTWNWPERRPGT